MRLDIHRQYGRDEETGGALVHYMPIVSYIINPIKGHRVMVHSGPQIQTAFAGTKVGTNFQQEG